jgi:hypothetical protein
MERDHFPSLGVDGRKILAMVWEGMDIITVAQERDRSRALVNEVIEFSI